MTEEHKATFAQAFRIALNQCVKTGTSPDELWLGPDMLKEFHGHLDFLSSMTGEQFLVYDGSSEYDGLTVRFMESDGLRVGKSFSPDGN